MRTGNYKYKHRLSKTKIYICWKNMMARCKHKHHKSYKDYGGRGITVCERWQKVENFIVDMGEKPIGLSLDRIDNNLGYSKENCRWVTHREQMRNTRRKRNVYYNGESECEASKRLGGSMCLVNKRIKMGWSLEKAFMTPVLKKQKNPKNGQYIAVIS